MTTRRTPSRVRPAAQTPHSPLPYLVSAAIVLVAAAVLMAMDHVPICKCGYVKLWHGVVSSSENSQHITDWYTFSHVIHGFAFYGLLWLLARRAAKAWRLAAAVAIEAAWEVFENTDFIINRYREATIALDYYGDSVINSVADISAMMVGFAIAARLPVRVVVLLTIAMEVFVGYWVRDNLMLNIIMLIYPVEAIKRWQIG